MMKLSVNKTFYIALVLLTGISCSKPKEDAINPPANSFDKAGMLSNLGKQLILPAYAELKKNIDSLVYHKDIFTATPSTTTLAGLRNTFTTSYLAYQRVSAFEFGPADVELIRANFNTFPCDTTQVTTKIATGDYNLGTVADLDNKGFPAIDFLLFGIRQTESEALLRFTVAPDAANAKMYLSTLIIELQTKTDAVMNGWDAAVGNYISAFTSNTGSNVGSPIGMLVNQLNYDLELLKNARIGIPLGKKSLGTPFPDKVEAFYSKSSLQLALAHLKSLENIYLGRNGQGVDGLGLDDYVTSTGAQHPLGPLNEVIKNKFVSAKTKLEAIPETLSQSVTTNASAVDAAYIELQQLVVLLKVDMTSALGVMITYQDNDGD